MTYTVLLALLCLVPAIPAAAGDFRDETIYLAITDRFVDGDAANNNLYGDEYVPGNLRYYQGGDFRGLIDNLDHIKSLGFTAVWITPPVMQPPGRYVNGSQTYDAAGYHGYWAWDFSRIDPHLESAGAAYPDLIKAAHAKGLKLIQDVVLNHGHGGDTHSSVRWHNERGTVRGGGKTFDYYADKQNWFNRKGPALADLLDFNDENPEVLRWFAGIYGKYRDLGVDAFRIDTLGWMSNSFWRGFAAEMHKGKKDFFLFGEAWTNDDHKMLGAYTKLSPGEPMNSSIAVLDMPLSAMGEWGPLEKVFKGGDYAAVDGALAHDGEYRDPTYNVTFLDNHDKPRFNGSKSEGTPASAEQYYDALNFYFTARGIPCVFYGTELMMPGGNDPDNRNYLGVTGIERSKTNPVYRHLKKLNALRAAAAPLRKGRQAALLSARDQYAFRRDYAGETAVVLLNKGGALAPLKAAGLPDGTYRELYTGATAAVKGGALTAEVPPHGLRVFVKGIIKGLPWELPGGPEAK
jgi:cyclomaltodextrin glucanotransferase